MDNRRDGRRGGLTTSALVSAGGLVVAAATGVGVWVGHEQSTTTESTDTRTTTDTQTSTGDRTATDQGISQGTAGSGSSDATTTGS